ncbi:MULTISPECIES: hypothetical protein [unclassified Cupriavidus]|uniref:hypothetical protein n=1 Tax=unclassified Cupriavidus TaxID=2640874 RepID=UPI0010F8481B|nr:MULTISPECIES: hypothetical protein [unclassified Cupriavidus]MWL86490.1 hypothetical protein [Cupriavidus sp. SW-Y-13]
MSDHPRFTINRSMVILLPEQPFVDWILAVDPEPPPTLSVEAVRDDASVFLLPEDAADTPENAQQWVEQRWRAMFEFMLAEWFDESLWPATLSLDMFRKWFSVKYHSMIWDLSPETTLDYEDWEEDDDDSSTMLH